MVTYKQYDVVDASALPMMVFPSQFVTTYIEELEVLIMLLSIRFVSLSVVHIIPLYPSNIELLITFESDDLIYAP